MSEYVRSVKVHIEVDTNKQTYTLDIEDEEVPEIRRRLDEFVHLIEQRYA